MHRLIWDIRYGLRFLRHNVSFTTAAVITLALGIGVNTAIFSLVNAVLFKTLPFEEPEDIVAVQRSTGAGAMFSYPDYLDYRDRTDIFEELFAFSLAPMSVGEGGMTKLHIGQLVNGNYFRALRVDAALGRTLTPEDDRNPGEHSVVVVGHEFWRSKLGGREDVIGETLTLNGHEFVIVGVAPEGFVGCAPVPAPEMWMPMMMQDVALPDRERLDDRNSRWLRVMGRLKPDVDREQAHAQLTVLAEQMREIDPDRYENDRPFVYTAQGIGLPPEGRRIAAMLSVLVASMVGLVLLIACANVANLLLARSAARRREIGIRLSLGASRGQLIRQLLVESTMLALLGGVLGLLGALWAMDAIDAAKPQLPYGLQAPLDFRLDWRVLTFTAGLSLLTGLIFGLLPALQATKTDLVTALKDVSPAAGLRHRQSRLRSMLIVGQVATSLVLLIGAGLFVRSLLNARLIDPGFEHESVLFVNMNLDLYDYDTEGGIGVYTRLLERISALPGVESASVDAFTPLTLSLQTTDYWIEGRPPADEDEVEEVVTDHVSPGNLRTLGISLLAGRDFQSTDTSDAPPVIIVNKAFADMAWPDESPLGNRVRLGSDDDPWREVVGVVATVRILFLGEDPRPAVYVPYTQDYFPMSSVLVRTTGDPLAVAPAVVAAMHELNPDLSPVQTSTLTNMISFALLPAKFAAGLFGLFGILALALCSCGLYGVMSYFVNLRTREIGIRLALGARRGDVLRHVLKHGLILTVAGLVIGLAIALAGARLLSSLLYDMQPADPTTFALVTLILLLVAMLATFIPARRATRVDPMRALRCE